MAEPAEARVAPAGPAGRQEIYIGGIPNGISKDVIRELFKSYGGVAKLNVIRSRRKTAPSYAFVRLRAGGSEVLEKAVKELDGCEVGGKAIRVQKRRPPAEGKRRQRIPKAKHDQVGNGIQPAWYPPGAEAKSRGAKKKVYLFKQEFNPMFYVPRRIANVPNELIVAVNDFHFAMMNDLPRNEFYYNALKEVINADSTIVEIGLG
eukprot:1337567-Amorphochlora_amoeboformis.AAC.2